MTSLLSWIQSTQNWFTKTEKSSGFRPYLIFLMIEVFFAIIVFTFFGQNEDLKDFTIFALKYSFIGFIAIFFIKSIWDPDFCRSEKHVEAIKKLEFTQQKGDVNPIPIDSDIVLGSGIKVPQLPQQEGLDNE